MGQARARCVVAPCGWGRFHTFVTAEAASDALSWHVVLQHPRLSAEQLDAMFAPGLLTSGAAA